MELNGSPAVHVGVHVGVYVGVCWCVRGCVIQGVCRTILERCSVWLCIVWRAARIGRRKGTIHSNVLYGKCTHQVVHKKGKKREGREEKGRKE
jgi:hypothetical protein